MAIILDNITFTDALLVSEYLTDYLHEYYITRRLVGVHSGYMHGIGEWAAEWPMAMRRCCLLGNCVLCR